MQTGSTALKCAALRAVLTACALMLGLQMQVLAAGAAEVSAAAPVALPTGAELSPQGDGSIDLSALKGRVVYLDFWASWCGPCRLSFPWLGDMQQRYGAQGFVVVAVNLDKNRDLAAGFLREFQPRFPIVYDRTGKLAEQFHVASMPYSLLLDRSGKVQSVHNGFSNANRGALESEIRQLLN